MAAISTLPQAADGTFTFERWIEMAINNDIDDDRIYQFLCPPLPPNHISRWIKRIQRIEEASKPPTVSASQWKGKKSRVKGRAFETLVASVLKTIRSFKTWKNVGTTTNEIDLLVQIGPGLQILPTIRQWGTHFVCECKLVKEGINATWIGKLNSVLELHQSEVGILISSQGPPRGKVKTQIYVHAFKTPPRVMVCISLEDLRQCENGTNFLRLISTRYLETKTGAASLVAS